LLFEEFGGVDGGEGRVAVEWLEIGGDVSGILVEQTREGDAGEGRAVHGEWKGLDAAAAEEEEGGCG
jgi:hypothetical protein